MVWKSEISPHTNTNMEQKSIPTHAFYPSHSNEGKRQGKDHLNHKRRNEGLGQTMHHQVHTNNHLVQGKHHMSNKINNL